MQSSAFVFGTDLLDEGCDTVLGRLQERGGLDGISFSATYHDARDVFPHNPSFHVFRNEGDVAWFTPRPAHYASGLIPRKAAAAGEDDVLAQLCAHAERRGMAVSAWTIFLHNSALAAAHPDCATRNVYGDPYLTDLCPAHPRVRAYCRELAADVARHPVQRLLAESLHYRPLEHGEHHERYLIALPPEARTLLSLCFCAHCRAAGTRADVDADRLADDVRAALEPVWLGEPAVQEGSAPLLAEAAREPLARYVDARVAVVTSLVAEVRESMAGSGVALSFVDHGGAMSHVMPGTSADDEVALSSRKLGIDAAAVAAACDELSVLGYVDTPARLEAMLRSYRRQVGEGGHLSVALRPLLPDCRSEENFAAKVAVAAAARPDGIDFYHYAMMPLNRLDWIRRALAGAAP